MNRTRTSIIWKISDDDFKHLVNTSKSMSALLRNFGMENKGGNYMTCRTRIKKMNISTSHFLNRTESSNLTRKMTIEELNKNLILDSTIARNSLKEYLLRFNLLEYQCSNCNNCGEWDGKKLLF